MAFRACRVFQSGSAIETRVTPLEIEELSAGEVVVRVSYSSLNYKDARAVTGRGKPIMRRFPLNAGIDLAGVVETTILGGRVVFERGSFPGSAEGRWLTPAARSATARRAG